MNDYGYITDDTPRGYFTEIMWGTAIFIAVVLFTFYAMHMGWV